MGTEQFPFDRFMKGVDRLKSEGILKEDVFVQLGSCVFEPEHCSWERFISYGEMAARIKEASLVISHAGAGTTLLCLRLRKRPILVPRMKKFGEHVDDHQVFFAENFEASDRVDAVYEIDELETIVKKRLLENASMTETSIESVAEELTLYLNNLLDSWG